MYDAQLRRETLPPRTPLNRCAPLLRRAALIVLSLALTLMYVAILGLGYEPRHRTPAYASSVDTSVHAPGCGLGECNILRGPIEAWGTGPDEIMVRVCPTSRPFGEGGLCYARTRGSRCEMDGDCTFWGDGTGGDEPGLGCRQDWSGCTGTDKTNDELARCMYLGMHDLLPRTCAPI